MIYPGREKKKKKQSSWHLFLVNSSSLLFSSTCSSSSSTSFLNFPQTDPPFDGMDGISVICESSTPGSLCVHFGFQESVAKKVLSLPLMTQYFKKLDNSF